MWNFVTIPNFPFLRLAQTSGECGNIDGDIAVTAVVQIRRDTEIMTLVRKTAQRRDGVREKEVEGSGF